MSLSAPFSAWEWELAARYLRTTRKDGGVTLVSMIAYAGIAAAVAVLIIVMSIMNGFRADLLTRMLGYNGHAVIQGDVLLSSERTKVLQRLSQTPGVISATPIVTSMALASTAQQRAPALIRGVDPQILRRTPIIENNIKAGSLSGFGQGPYGGDGILVGQELAEQLGVTVGSALNLLVPGGAPTPFGDTPAQSKTYRVIGIFQVGMSQYDSLVIYMPLNQAQLFLGSEEAWSMIELKVKDPEKIKDLKPALQAAAGPGGVVLDWTQQNKDYWDAIQVEHSAMGLILGGIVVIATLNIISGLVMLVKNKGRDIAILRTMGASRGAIVRIFILVGMIIGGLGVLTGVVLGLLFCANIHTIQWLLEQATGVKVFNPSIYLLSQVPAKIDPFEVIRVICLSLLFSGVASILPALRAAKLDPVEALRYE